MAKASYDKTDKLDDRQWARLRTEVYFGSRELTEVDMVGYDASGQITYGSYTFVPAVYTLYRELLDNALDEIVGHSAGDTIKVDYNEVRHEFTVQDNGRGIPAGMVADLLGSARAGRNFRERGNVAGTNGVGAAAANFCSQSFKVVSSHNGEKFTGAWTENAKKPDDKHDFESMVSKCPKADHGTWVTIIPSSRVFPHLDVPLDFMRSRVYEIAAANPGIKIYFNGSRVKIPSDMRRGILKGRSVISLPIKGETETVSDHRSLDRTGKVTKHKFRSDFYIVPDFFDGTEDGSHSIVNSICAYRGGVHIDKFKTAFFKAVLTAIEPQAKKQKLKLTRGDVSSGLLIYNVTQMASPNFDSQTKTQLTNTEVGKLIESAVDLDTVKRLVKSNQKWVDQILERCALRTNKKDLEDAKRASKKNARTKVAKLFDATGKDRKKCILFVAEGDSAIKKLTEVRDPKIHGGLPLKGKIMNVNGVSPAKMMASEALKDIMNAIGLHIGERAIRSQLRYGQINITVDEDEDGKNIMALIVNFLYTNWPELLDPDLPPFVYKFETPLFICTKGNQRKYYFSTNAHQFDPKKYKGWSISRAKGCGRLDTENWQDCIDNPSLIPIQEDGSLKEVLDLIFNGSRSDDRKEWLAA